MWLFGLSCEAQIKHFEGSLFFPSIMRHSLLDLRLWTVWTPSINWPTNNTASMICSPLLLRFSGFSLEAKLTLKMTQWIPHSVLDRALVIHWEWWPWVEVSELVSGEKKWDQFIIIIIITMGWNKLYFLQIFFFQQSIIKTFHSHNWPKNPHKWRQTVLSCVLGTI